MRAGLAMVPRWDCTREVRTIALFTLKRCLDGCSGRDDLRGRLLAWHQHVRRADWARAADVKADFGKASNLRDG